MYKLKLFALGVLSLFSCSASGSSAKFDPKSFSKTIATCKATNHEDYRLIVPDLRGSAMKLRVCARTYSGVVGVVVRFVPSAGEFIPVDKLVGYLPKLGHQLFLDKSTEAAQLDKDVRRTIRATLRTVASPAPDDFLLSRTSFLTAWDDVAEVEIHSLGSWSRHASWAFANAQGNYTIPRPVLAIFPNNDPVADWAKAIKSSTLWIFFPAPGSSSWRAPIGVTWKNIGALCIDFKYFVYWFFFQRPPTFVRFERSAVSVTAFRGPVGTLAPTCAELCRLSSGHVGIPVHLTSAHVGLNPRSKSFLFKAHSQGTSQVISPAFKTYGELP
ncbi:hypothetical protein DFH07DRAFT_780038 [Mycena maculata]|uniref:Uncharacterized protein n=1 Tax=Mycena maculata TaxID=230809 RepID=A0AAD7MW46_9AGAR|nr:hypothetical protein DFH07DRAFT_780038 [Mycena maculata]